MKQRGVIIKIYNRYIRGIEDFVKIVEISEKGKNSWTEVENENEVFFYNFFVFYKIHWKPKEMIENQMNYGAYAVSCLLIHIVYISSQILLNCFSENKILCVVH